MLKFEYFNSIDKKFPWSLIGCIISILFGIFGLYAVFIYEKLPELKIEVISNTPVFSISEEVENLSILFDGEDIRKSNQQLSVITAKLTNSGNQSITTADFDKNDPFSIGIDNGNIIKSDVMDTTDYYFKKIFSQSTSFDNKIELPSFILNPGQNFVIKFLVLHDTSDQPTIISKGRVAKIESVEVVRYPEDKKMGLLPSSIDGDTPIQIIRILVYGIGTIIVLIVLLFSLIITLNKFEKYSRNRKANRILAIGESYLKTLDPDLAIKLKPFLQLIATGAQKGRSFLSPNDTL